MATEKEDMAPTIHDISLVCGPGWTCALSNNDFDNRLGEDPSCMLAEKKTNCFLYRHSSTGKRLLVKKKE